MSNLFQEIFYALFLPSRSMKHFQTILLCIAITTTSLLFHFESIQSLYDATEMGPIRASRTIPSRFHPSLRGMAHLQRSKAMTTMGTQKATPKLDFFIAGFPKCGTTTLLYAFGAHNDTDIGKTEKCSIVNPNIPDGTAYTQLDQALAELSPGVKRGIKCPSGIKNARSLERLQKHSPGAKLIIGVRHPVLFFQSYYNYRITEIHDRQATEHVPPIETLVGKREWRGVSTDYARFELFLMQLGKADLTASMLDQLKGHPHMSIKPNTFKVFFYTLEQMEDHDEGRTVSFRTSLQKFLGLKNPLPPVGHENLNHFVGKKAHKETVDICQDKYRPLRKELIHQGKKTSTWIQKNFLQSPDVVVANRNHLVELLNTWGSDPCQDAKGKHHVPVA